MTAFQELMLFLNRCVPCGTEIKVFGQAFFKKLVGVRGQRPLMKFELYSQIYQSKAGFNYGT